MKICNGRNSARMLRTCIVNIALVIGAQISLRSIAYSSSLPSDTLVVGFENRPKSLDPRLISGDPNSQFLEELRFLPLVSANEDGSLKFMLAEKVTTQDATHFLVQLRNGVKFANGETITPKDVVETYNYVRASNSPLVSPRRGAFQNVKSVRETSPRAIEFVLTEPDVSFVQNLVVGILPTKALSTAPEDLMLKGYESGPFILESHNDQEIKLVRNEHYSFAAFGHHLAHMSKVIFKIITDNNTRYSALLKGDLDIVQNTLDADKIAELKKKNGSPLQVTTRPGLNTTYLAFNTKNKLFADEKVRQAIGMAIQRDEIVQFSLQGLAIKSTGMFPPEFPFFDASLQSLPYDLQKAKKLLQDSGVVEGSAAAQFTIKVTTHKERIAVAKAIASQLKAIGLRVDVQALEPGLFTDQLNRGNVQAWIAPWTGFKDPDHLRFVFHSQQVPPLGGNRGFFKDAQIDALLEAGKVQTDLTKRKQIYFEAQRLLSSKQPYIYLWHRLNHVVTSKKVNGYRLYADSRYFSLADVTKEK